MSTTPSAGRRRTGTGTLVVTVLGAFAVLVGLGSWQLYRMVWKQEILDRIELRQAEPPVTLDTARALAGAGEDVRFLRVVLSGMFAPDGEIHLYGIRDGKPGWHIIVPLLEPDGGGVLVDRGIVPVDFKDPETRIEASSDETVSFVGQVRVPETQGLFVPDNDTVANEWYWRDLDEMSGGDATTNAFLIEALEPTGPAGAPTPHPLLAASIPNRHLEYALTWYALAAALLGVFWALMRTRSRP